MGKRIRKKKADESRKKKKSSWKLPNEIPWKMSIEIIWNSYGCVMSANEIFMLETQLTA